LIAVSRDRVPVPRHSEFAVRYRAAPAASDRSLTEPLQRFCVAWHPLVEHLVEQFRATLILDVLTHCLPRNVLHRSGLSLGAATQCLCFRVREAQCHSHTLNGITRDTTSSGPRTDLHLEA